MPNDSTTLALNGNPVELLIGGKRYSSLAELEPQHYRFFFTLLGFTDPIRERRLVPFSLTEFCNRCGIDRNSPKAAEAAAFLRSLLAGSMRVKDPATGAFQELPLFENATMIERDNL